MKNFNLNKRAFKFYVTEPSTRGKANGKLFQCSIFKLSGSSMQHAKWILYFFESHKIISWIAKIMKKLWHSSNKLIGQRLDLSFHYTINISSNFYLTSNLANDVCSPKSPQKRCSRRRVSHLTDSWNFSAGKTAFCMPGRRRN